MQKVPLMMCGGCGYEVESLSRGTMCPECGRFLGRFITPWPGTASVAWRLVGAPLFGSGVIVVLFLGWRILSANGWGVVDLLLGSVLAVAAILHLLLLVFWPLMQASMLVEHHEPQRSRERTFFGLLLLGWGASVAIGAGLVVLLGAGSTLVNLVTEAIP